MLSGVLYPLWYLITTGVNVIWCIHKLKTLSRLCSANVVLWFCDRSCMFAPYKELFNINKRKWHNIRNVHFLRVCFIENQACWCDKWLTYLANYQTAVAWLTERAVVLLKYSLTNWHPGGILHSSFHITGYIKLEPCWDVRGRGYWDYFVSSKLEKWFIFLWPLLII